MFGKLSKRDIAIVFGTAFAAAKAVVQEEDVKRKTNKKKDNQTKP